MSVGGGPVFVTDGALRPALAVVRSLGAAGEEVHVLSPRPGSLAGSSRFAAREHRVPSVEREPAAFARAVSELLALHPGALVVPVSEPTLGTLLPTGLRDRFPMTAPSRAAYDAASDKPQLLALARAVGLDVPEGALMAPTPPLRLPRGLDWPVVAKPPRSCWLRDGRWHRGGARLVRDPAGLEAAFRAVGGQPLWIEEYQAGHGEGFFFLRQRGQVRARFAHRRLREKPPSGGVATLAESIAPDPVLEKAVERLLARLDYDGVGMLELRRRPDGGASVLELNARPWGSMALAVAAGVDFPRLMVAAARGEAVPSSRPREGQRVRWLLGDLDHVLACARRGEGFGAAWRVTRSFFDGTGTDVWRRDDPRPFARELRDWVRRREPDL